MKNTQGQKNLKQSETRTILRSSITLNPYNPKRHTDEQEWKYIDGFDGRYQVSSMGNVRNIKTGKEMKLRHDKDGYLCVGLSNGGRERICKVHRLVGNAFIPNPEALPCIDHKNGDRDDNQVANLRWCTVRDNNGFTLAREKKSEALRGKKKSALAVANNRAAQHKTIVYQYDFDGTLVREWDSLHAIERELGFARPNISKCLRGACSQNYGFVWAGHRIENIGCRGTKRYKTVQQVDNNGNVVKEWPNMSIAAKALGVSHKAISNCVLGKTNTCKGYIWRGIK